MRGLCGSKPVAGNDFKHNLDEHLEELKNEISSHDTIEGKFSGKAFIIFNSQYQAKRLIEEFKMSWWLRIYFYLYHKI